MLLPYLGSLDVDARTEAEVDVIASGLECMAPDGRAGNLLFF